MSITIPKKFIPRDEDLVILPRFEYEALLKRKDIREVKLTASERRAMEESEREFKRGDYLTLDELEKSLASSRSKTRRKGR